MNIWGQIVHSLALGLFTLSQAFGGNTGLAIITISCVIRLALLPLTIAVQRRTNQQKEILQRIQPKLEKINKRYKNNPEKAYQKTMVLYKQEGYRPIDPVNLLGSLAQLPVIAAFNAAIREGLSTLQSGFLWIKDLSAPNPLLAILVAGLTLLASRISADSSQPAKAAALLMPAAITLFFAWRLSAGLGLYWATSTAIGMVQSAIVKRPASKSR
jgi:YidC/Oxa1 family membrane protein insertase